MTKQAIVSGIVSAIVALVAVFSFGGGNFAGVSHLSGLNVGADGLSVGTASTASTLSYVQKGTCTILANSSVAATSTANFDCVAAGVEDGDTVFVTQAASSTIASQYVIKGAVASSTDGYITFSILNLRGTAATPAATNGFGSSTAYLIIR